MLLLIALVAGGCNLGYVLATVHGEVMRVLLLFYLAPLWTVLLAACC
jgi:drug/metabolite transporter (DMT)-like permease